MGIRLYCGKGTSGQGWNTSPRLATSPCTDKKQSFPYAGVLLNILPRFTLKRYDIISWYDSCLKIIEWNDYSQRQRTRDRKNQRTYRHCPNDQMNAYPWKKWGGNHENDFQTNPDTGMPNWKICGGPMREWMMRKRWCTKEWIKLSIDFYPK